jgi:signal transduction histidine kinase
VVGQDVVEKAVKTSACQAEQSRNKQAKPSRFIHHFYSIEKREKIQYNSLRSKQLRCAILFLSALVCSSVFSQPAAQFPVVDTGELLSSWFSFEAAPSEESLGRFKRSLDLFAASGIYYNYSREFRWQKFTGPGVIPPEQIKAMAANPDLALKNEAAIRDALRVWLKVENTSWRIATNTYFMLLMALLGFSILLAAFLMFTLWSLRKSRSAESSERAFAAALMRGQEMERKRLAMGLHDGPLQELRAIPGTGEVSREIRTVCTDIMPPDFTRLKFSDIIRDLAGRFEKSSDIPCTVEVDEPLPNLPSETALQVYRMIQEGLNNIEKHSRAHKAVLVLRKDRTQADGRDCLLIALSDDGVGLKPGQMDKPGGQGMGFLSMRERAGAIGAKLDLISETGQGLMLRIEVPVNGVHIV